MVRAPYPLAARKLVAQRLAELGVETFLPTVTEVHRWSDRKKSVELPLFTCYVFAKFIPKRSDRLHVLRVGGVLGLVGSQGEGSPIPDEQIDAVRALVEGTFRGLPIPSLRSGNACEFAEAPWKVWKASWFRATETKRL